MQCPMCHQNLQGVDYQGVHIETCPGCGGDWLAAGELDNIVTARQTRFTEEECLAVAKAATITGVIPPASDRHLTCPQCGGTTEPINYGDDSGLIIDKCPKCKGIWVPRGELDKIDELVHGWDDELPADLAKYGPKLRQILAQEDQDETVSLSHVRLINSLINGILDLLGD